MSVPEESNASCACAAATSPRRIAWEIGELAVGFGFILAVIWTPRPLHHWLSFIALGWFMISISLSFEGWRAMGCCVAGFWRSTWVVGVAVLMAAVATFFAASFHTLHHPGRPEQWLLAFGGYTIWALLQQLLLQGYFLARLLRIVPNPNIAAAVSAFVFALAHLPNPVLTPLTLVWGLTACLVFVRSRNVYPLAIAHAIFGICVAITIPAAVLHNMRVGLGYIDYSPSQLDLTQIGRDVSK
ncbi:CPBP family glutamic-type intramembrane protease [Telmatobacter sp. DSM 110680]|uniref:CPBP family glutamic-type intramembrane protease n=1 Tax=Telmatobacter sp. DSM 110680 TaxID=3036704 RepID=A0AAU7DJP9_9BACT